MAEPIRVLIADDHPIVRQGLEVVLAAQDDMELVGQATNGDEAVRESIVNAVYRASPLPPPRDPRAFERRLEIVFRPKE